MRKLQAKSKNFLWTELAENVQVAAAAGLLDQERVGAGRHLSQGASL